MFSPGLMIRNHERVPEALGAGYGFGEAGESKRKEIFVLELFEGGQIVAGYALCLFVVGKTMTNGD